MSVHKILVSVAPLEPAVIMMMEHSMNVSVKMELRPLELGLMVPSHVLVSEVYLCVLKSFSLFSGNQILMSVHKVLTFVD